jgi:1-deoxy-D-xylulose-5-phosphate synthase
MVRVALDAASLLEADGITTTVIDARYVKPLDPRLLSWARRHPVVVTVEDNVRAGGFGSAVAEALSGLGIPVLVLALPDAFIEHGSQGELLQRLGLDADTVAGEIRRAVRGSSIAASQALGGQPAS